MYGAGFAASPDLPLEGKGWDTPDQTPPALLSLRNARFRA